MSHSSTGRVFISRRDMIRALALAPVALSLSRWQRFASADGPATTAPAEESPRDPGFATSKIATTDLGHGLTVISGPGGNITVLSAGDQSLVIDSGIGGPRADEVVKAVSSAAGGSVPRTLINTHYHYDHVGGNAALAAAGASNRVAQTKTLQHMGETVHVALLNTNFPPSAAEGRPTKTFDDTFEIQNVKLTRIDPAHTDGDIVVHFPDANVLVAGDLFFNGMYPFIDYATGGSLAGMIAATAKLLDMVDDQTQIVPGHGPVGGKPALKAFHDMLVSVRDTLTPLIKNGSSLKDLQAARPLADLDVKWGQRMFHGSNFIHLVYDELKG